MLRRLFPFICALSFLSCGGQKFLPSQFKSSSTALKLLPEVTELAKKESSSAALLGIVSSANWSNGLVMWTNDEIDSSYVSPDGLSHTWDFYFTKNLAGLTPTENDLYVAKQADLFGFRYIAADSNDGKGGFVKLSSKQFSPEFTVPSNQALSQASIDSDLAINAAKKYFSDNFISLKATSNPIRPEPRKVVLAAYSLEQNPNLGPVWEIAATFEDSFGNKKGALIYVNASTGSVPSWEIDPFEIKVDMQREYVNRKTIHMHEVRTRDFTNSKDLLQEWTESAQRSRELSRSLESLPKAPNP